MNSAFVNVESMGLCRSQQLASAPSLTRALNADANMGHGFAIVMAHVGALRPCGATAPVD